jgi:uncharacterized integral membrane protein (TIGR00698 family)
MFTQILFVLLLLVCASGWVEPPWALVLGLAFGLALEHPYAEQSQKGSRFLLQISVVGLGFGMNLQEVLRVGRHGFAYTAAGIVFALTVGMGLGRMLRVPGKPAFLISTGTAICGGSAIAAVGPIMQASNEEMAVSLGTVFLLNSVALLVFPGIGVGLRLSQTQFGLWAALAIHDTSSVVGAAAKYGAGALAVGTTVKLARALWIVPLAVGTALAKGVKARVQWPWFIAFFCLAALANTYLGAGAAVYPWLVKAAKLGLTVTLFLIGSGISAKTLKQVGVRPLVQGVVLWGIVSVVSLWVIRVGWVGL